MLVVTDMVISQGKMIFMILIKVITEQYDLPIFIKYLLTYIKYLTIIDSSVKY